MQKWDRGLGDFRNKKTSACYIKNLLVKINA